MTTALRNFDTDLDREGVVRRVHHDTVAAPRDEVQVTARPSESVAFVGKPVSDWQWSDLRDYVVAEIEKRFGQFPRDSRKEASIFKSFIGRWGIDTAVAIARFAFDVEDGRWRGAPVGINRFCKNSDPYFASVIAQRLAEQRVNW